jgi:hypothetical protein
MAVLLELGRQIQKHFWQILDLCIRRPQPGDQHGTTLVNSSTLDSLSPKSVQKEQQRFQLWSVTLGMFDSGHSSLAYRLEDAPEACDLIIDLLKDLDMHLTEGTAFLRNSPYYH